MAASRPRWLPLAALIGAALLAWRLPTLWPLVATDLTGPPARAEAVARAFLAREGIALDGHAAAVQVELDAPALDHADSLAGRAATQALVAHQALAGHRVTLKRRGDPDVVWATVHPDGQVLRWSRQRQDDDSAGVADSARAGQLALAALARVERDPTLPPWRLTGAAVRDRPRRTDRSFTFERLLARAPELKERAQVVVAGDAVTSVIRLVVVPDDAVRARRAAEAPRTALAAVGYLALAAAVVVAFALLLRGLRAGTVRLGPPALVTALVFGGSLATFFLEPAWLMAWWEPLWPRALAPLRGLQSLGIANAWVALVLFTAIAAGDAEDRRGRHDRGASLWRLLRGEWRHPAVGAASRDGFLVGLACGGVMALAVLALEAAAGAQTALQPRGFFVKVLDAWSPALTSVLFFASVALAEELGYRFYLGTLLARVTGRRALAIWLPALLYGLTHTELDFLPPADPFWARPLVLTLVGATWGWAFFRFDALTVVLSHLTADLFIFNWPRLASADAATVAAAAATILLPLAPWVLARPRAARGDP